MTSKILVVDDEKLFTKLFLFSFRKQIKNNEYEFVFAHNGLEALEKFKNETGFDLILTDINMPEMDGLTLMMHLRKIDQKIPIIVISAYSDLNNQNRALELGAFEFINKPIDFFGLEISMRKALNL
jgi:CheY-like chemotaxis protein